MKRTIGLISANYTRKDFGALTEKRTLASLPYGGRYRLIDFPLSNMINSNITTVGLVMPYNFRSLIDHVGVGKPWSLNRKSGGMFILPGSVYGIKAESTKFLQRDFINNIRYFLRDSAENVIICGSNTIFNMDMRPLVEHHEQTGAGITMVYKTLAGYKSKNSIFIDLDDDKVESIHYATRNCSNLFIDCLVIKRKLLLNITDWFESLEHLDLIEIIARNLPEMNVHAYEFKGYVAPVETIEDYKKANLDLLNNDIRAELFESDNKITTKVQDVAPANYCGNAKIKDSLVSDGCIIEGTVENSIIFRSTHIHKGAVVKNSIIMQHCEIKDDSFVSNVICDKYVTINNNSKVEGGKKPLIIGKNLNL